MARNRKSQNERRRQLFLADLERQRRAKGILTEPADKPTDDGSFFSEEREVIGELPPVKLDGLVYCPAGPHRVAAEEMRGNICYWHKRHPPTPANQRVAGVAFPPGFWGRP
jgi:hypothetical protein